VTTPGGTATSAATFRVLGAPGIASFTPTSGPVGTSVAITGTDFDAATSVMFNGVAATFTVLSATAIQATVPAGATTGPISVTTPVDTSTSGASFTVTATLLVSRGGNGAGAVSSTSTPPNPVTVGEIDCGASCSSTYAVGTVVTLTATPAVGSNFTAWTGCDSVSGATCTVTMNAARSVAATFTLQTFPLSVKKASPLGIGDGTVTSTSNPGSPNQINCGSNCTVTYNYGTVVTLTASPALLSIFNGWTGCDSVSGTTCTVTIRAAKSVTANFLP
jgi:hypothetical protein